MRKFAMVCLVVFFVAACGDKDELVNPSQGDAGVQNEEGGYVAEAGTQSNECFYSSDCPARAYCVDGKCVECVTDDDCNGGVCNYRHVCVYQNVDAGTKPDANNFVDVGTPQPDAGQPVIDSGTGNGNGDTACPNGCPSGYICTQVGCEKAPSNEPPDAGQPDSGMPDAGNVTRPDAGQFCIPSQEICDGKDNDCDGQTDEGELCDGKLFCYHGSCVECRSNEDCMGASCVEGKCGGCEGGPTPEICDGKDNDCDGLTDEDDPTMNPCGEYSGLVCVDGACVEGCRVFGDLDHDGVVDDSCGLGHKCVNHQCQCNYTGYLVSYRYGWAAGAWLYGFDCRGNNLAHSLTSYSGVGFLVNDGCFQIGIDNQGDNQLDAEACSQGTLTGMLDVYACSNGVDQKVPVVTADIVRNPEVVLEKCVASWCSGGDTADCDHDNRCETNLLVDSANCGWCGDLCPVGQVCSGGLCYPVSPDAGTPDTGIQPDAGSSDSGTPDASEDAGEDAGVSLNRCRGEGDLCVRDNVEDGRCEGGNCIIYRCKPGWDNLDGLSENGCEAPISGYDAGTPDTGTQDSGSSPDAGRRACYPGWERVVFIPTVSGRVIIRNDEGDQMQPFCRSESNQATSLECYVPKSNVHFQAAVDTNDDGHEDNWHANWPARKEGQLSRYGCDSQGYEYARTVVVELKAGTTGAGTCTVLQ